MVEKDIVIIGSGSAGYVAAIHAAHLGANIALIEKDKIGGTCLNRGCLPTKTLARTVEILMEVRKAHEYGVEVDNIRVDFLKIMTRKKEIVEKMVSNVEKLIKTNNISYYNGVGRIFTPNLVKVNGEEIATRKIIIATGSKPVRLPIPGVDTNGVMSTDGILELEKLPTSLVIIGGGYVGIEFAGIFSSLGTKVTIIEMLPRILNQVDAEIVRRFTQVLSKRGVVIKTEVSVKAIRKNRELLNVCWDSPAGEQNTDGEAVLIATGRKPFTEELDLPKLGIKTTQSGILVNDKLETNVANIYAVGDVVGKSMLAHVASYQGEIASENAMGFNKKIDYRVIPSCIFTQPEIACVGMTEEEAMAKRLNYQVSKFPFSACSRAMLMGESIGLVKMICDRTNRKILGMHILGPHASDLIAEGVLAMQVGATAYDIINAIHVHPTLPEAIREAAMGQIHEPIHIKIL